PKHGDTFAMTENKPGGETVGMVPFASMEDGKIKADKDVTQFSFAGEVGQMQCKCHKDEWAIFAFAINPINGQKKLLGSNPVKDEEDGKAKMQDYVMEKARIFLKENFNLTPEKAKNITVLRGQDAANAEALAMAKIDNTVH
ncbi:hypothetical protein GV729_24690, partial [Pseudomonas sp. Fl4BN2]|nr:hypothetical protein [Pseudomonas sp. Fl4BN2]